MDNQRLWQHRSKEEDKEAILSLNVEMYLCGQ